MAFRTLIPSVWSGIAAAAALVMCTAPAQAAAPDNYLINPGDELELDILEDEDPPQRFIVGRDGAVQLPFIGGVEVAAVPVGEARRLIRQTYIEREIFVNPGVELSVAGFRPISVLGDVREPGNFDYQPFMTAEQAAGLAGGPAVSAVNEEARILERRNLEGTLTGLEYDLALTAARYARVQAQIAGAGEVDWAAVPGEVRAAVDRELFAGHSSSETRILHLDLAEAKAQRALLEGAIAAAEQRGAILVQRARVQQAALDLVTAELARMRDLASRGLVPQADVNSDELAVARAEDELLELRERASAAQVQLAGLRGDLSGYDASRSTRLLTEAQQHSNTISKLTAQRAALQDRLRLLQQWMNAAAGLETGLLVQYRARRRSPEGGMDTVELQPFDELLPGDLLVIAVKPPEALEDQP